MIGLWTKREFGIVLALLVLELIGLALIVNSGNSNLLALILVALAAMGQVAVALSFRARRKRAGNWGSNQR